MEIVVTGRNSEISESYRAHVLDKLQRIAKFDNRERISRVDVEVTHEKNPRDPATAAKVQLTVKSRGPAIRAEAISTDQHSALDTAIDRLERLMSKASDRRRIHRGQHNPPSLAEVVAPVIEDSPVAQATDDPAVRQVGPLEVQGDGPLVVREKTHASRPMTLDQALYEMELVGHDFYLFMEKDSMTPSVVYRRKGYDYGVLHLEVEE